MEDPYIEFIDRALEAYELGLPYAAKLLLQFAINVNRAQRAKCNTPS